jgi:hypothetical protein
VCVGQSPGMIPGFYPFEIQKEITTRNRRMMNFEVTTSSFIIRYFLPDCRQAGSIFNRSVRRTASPKQHVFLFPKSDFSMLQGLQPTSGKLITIRQRKDLFVLK